MTRTEIVSEEKHHEWMLLKLYGRKMEEGSCSVQKLCNVVEEIVGKRLKIIYILGRNCG